MFPRERRFSQRAPLYSRNYITLEGGNVVVKPSSGLSRCFAKYPLKADSRESLLLGKMAEKLWRKRQAGQHRVVEIR